jgi:SepF-like predicted cell division protein (DUF552 family)
MKEKFGEKIKSSGEKIPEEKTEEYVEVGPETPSEGKAKILVKPFSINDFDDIKPILDSLREGYTIALINIKPLKEKDLVELKRAINKLKKTTDAIEGDIAGFGEDYIVVTPSFATVQRSTQTEDIKPEAVPEESSAEDVGSMETY